VPSRREEKLALLQYPKPRQDLLRKLLFQHPRDITPIDRFAFALWLLAITSHQWVTHLTDITRRLSYLKKSAFMTLLARWESEDYDDHDYDESVIKPETDEERAARLEAQRQKDAREAR